MDPSFLEFPWDFRRDWREELSDRGLSRRARAFLDDPPPKSELDALPARERWMLRGASFIYRNRFRILAIVVLFEAACLFLFDLSRVSPLQYWLLVLPAPLYAVVLLTAPVWASWHVADLPFFRRPAESSWRPIHDEVCRLLLAAEARKHQLDGRSPKDDALAHPQRYSSRAEEIERIYSDPRNPVRTVGGRNWIAGLTRERLASEVHLAEESFEDLVALLKFYWEADHIALHAVLGRGVPPDVPEPEPEPEESMEQWAARFVAEFAARLQATESVDAAIEGYAENERARGVPEHSVQMRIAALRRVRDTRLQEDARERASRAAAKSKAPRT